MIDFEKVFGLNHFFEKNTENEKQTDIDTLEQSFAVLDNSFDSLLEEFLLIPLNELKESIETTKADVKRAFASFFDDFRQTAKLLVCFL
ncbi:hypothetical protein [Treponema sp.]|uniref:hypothetical protein n=1 Tax=Treponema sp. TaxID=166 RepID=UPI003F07B9EE